MKLLKQSTASTVMVFLVGSADHITGLASATLTITASKAGAAFASITPTVTDLGSGWYSLALTTTHTNTLGALALHITAASADPIDVLFQVIAIDIEDAVRLGLTAIPNAAAEAAGGLYTRGTGAGQINQPANGMIDTNIVRSLGTALAAPTVAGIPKVEVSDYASGKAPLQPTVAGRTLDVSAGGEGGIDWANIGSPTTVVGLSGTTVKEVTDVETTLATIAAYVDTEVAAIKAKTDNLPTDPADASDIAASFSSIAGTLSTIAGYLDTEIAAIKAKTDGLPSDPADASDIAASFSSISSTLSTIAGYVDTEVASIKSTVEGLPAASAVADAVWDEAGAGHVTGGSFGAIVQAISGGGGGGATASEVRDAILDYELFSGRTIRGHLRRMEGLFFGRVTGLLGALVRVFVPGSPSTTLFTALQDLAAGTRQEVDLGTSEASED